MVEREARAHDSLIAQLGDALASSANDTERAQKEVERLQSELKRKNDAIERTKSGKAKVQYPDHQSSNSGTSSLQAVQTALRHIIAECIVQYKKKADAILKKHSVATPSAAPSAAPSASAPTVQILQQNTSPHYNTIRQICFLDAAASAAASVAGTPGFYFDDSGNPPTPWAPVWRKITDNAACNTLATIGIGKTDASGALTSWTPTVGKTCQYSVGQWSYTASVVRQACPVPPAAPPPPPAAPWQNQVLFQGKFFKWTTREIDQMLSSCDFTSKDDLCQGSQEIADLATMMSSWGSSFKYDVSRCQLWVKPLWFKVWLTAGKTRKFTEARVLMHGMRSNEYEKLAADMSGFDMNFSRDGRMRYGFYASATDTIAADYNGGSGKYPDGSFNIGLLWVKQSALHGAYENYHLGATRSVATSGPPQDDAFSIRDQLLWLPLGLAVAQPKPKAAASSGS